MGCARSDVIRQISRTRVDSSHVSFHQEVPAMANIAMLGTGLIGMFYTMALQAKRSRDTVQVVCGKDADKTKAFAEKWGIPKWTTDMPKAVHDPRVDMGG